MSERSKILIFGGSFSPPTLAHEAIIAACLEQEQFDEVWVMPSGDRLDKTIAQDDEDRIRMLGIIKTERFGDNPRLRVSDFELKLPRPTKTSSTLPALAKRFPNVDFWFAFGRDSYLSMPDWPDGRELQKNLRMVVFYSGLGAIITAGNVMTVDLGAEYSDISSTKVREAMANGQSLEGLVSEPVAGYLAHRA